MIKALLTNNSSSCDVIVNQNFDDWLVLETSVSASSYIEKKNAVLLKKKAKNCLLFSESCQVFQLKNKKLWMKLESTEPNHYGWEKVQANVKISDIKKTFKKMFNFEKKSG